MRVWIKRVAVALAVSCVVAVAGAVLLVATVDPNRYKGTLTALVKERKNRTLEIRGDLKLTVFPRFGVKVGQATLSEFGSEKPFVSVESAHLSMALLPLLGQRLVVDEIGVQGLRATVVRHKNGSFNFDDLLQPSEGPSPIRFDIEGIELAGGELIYLDEKERNTVKLTQFALKSGQLADRRPAEIEVSAHVSADLPPLDAKLAAKGRLTLDAQAGTVAFDQGRLELAGVLPGMKADQLLAEGRSMRFDAAQRKVQAAELTLDFKGVVDNEPMTLQLKTPSLEVDLTRLALATRKLDVTLQANGAERKGTLGLAAARVDARVADGLLALESLRATGKGEVAGMNFSAFELAVPRLAADVARSGLQLQGVTMRANGTRTGEKFDLALDVPRLEVSDTRADGAGIKAGLKWGGARSLDLSVRVESLSGTGQALEAGLSLDGAIDGAALAVRPLKLAGRGAVQLQPASEKLSARLAGSFDESRFTATFDIEQLTKPVVNFVASLDRLNVDRYRVKPAQAQGTGGPAVRGGDVPVDLSGLKGLNLGGQLKVGALQVQNLKAQNVDMAVRIANGRAEIREMAAALYGGTLFGSGLLDGNTNAFAFKQRLNGVQVLPLLKDLAERDALEGKGTVTLDLTGSGKTVGAIKKSLAGQVNLQLRDGAIKGLNLAKSLREFRSRLATPANASAASDKSEKTDFSELDAQLSLAGGVATVRELQLKSPYLRATEGVPARIDVGNGQLDLVVRAMVVNTSAGQGGKALKDLKHLTVPVHITGPFDRWQYQIQWAALSGDLMKQAVERKLRDALPEAKPDAKQSLQDEAKERLLRGLLGR